MKTHTLGAGKFVEFILTRERNEKQNEDDLDGFGGRNWAGKMQQSMDRTHQLDNPSDEGSRHMAPRGCLMPVLKGKHDSHIHVAGITCMSLVK